MMEINSFIKKGFSLIELIIVLVIIGILIALFIKSTGKQIKEAQLYADMKIADHITSIVCPEYIDSFKTHNNLYDENNIMENHDFSIEHLKDIYKFKLPKYWENPELKYKNGLCVLSFSLPTSNPPLAVFRSTYKKINQDGNTKFIMYYPVIDYLIEGQLYYQNRYYKDLVDGIYYPGTFSDKWEVGTSTYTNDNLLQYISTVEGRQLNRPNSNNRNNADFYSLSYHGQPIPNNMKFIH